MVREEFLHFLWKYNLYQNPGWTDSEGNVIEVLSPGEYNRDSGPDFFNARVKRGSTVWAGNIEIHYSSGQWFDHNHHTDPAYDNTILHVVVVINRTTLNSRGIEVPTVELSYSKGAYEKYLNYINSPLAIPCEADIGLIRQGLIPFWLETVAVGRMEKKVSELKEELLLLKGDWEELFYRRLAASFGSRVNRHPFAMLSTILPIKVLRHHAGDIFGMEALLFGAAGLLEEGMFRGVAKDEYFRKLATEFRGLKKKYSITPLHGRVWKLGRMRPAGFPAIRVSQFADLISRNPRLFSLVCRESDIETLRVLLSSEASEYWKNHYIFGKESPDVPTRMGRSSVDLILINVVAPVLFAYGRVRDKQNLMASAVNLLESLPPEQNRIMRMWKNNGINVVAALQSQGAYELFTQYCKKRRCLDCHIGSNLISLGVDLARPEQTLLEP